MTNPVGGREGKPSADQPARPGSDPIPEGEPIVRRKTGCVNYPDVGRDVAFSDRPEKTARCVSVQPNQPDQKAGCFAEYVLPAVSRPVPHVRHETIRIRNSFIACKFHSLFPITRPGVCRPEPTHSFATAFSVTSSAENRYAS